MADLTYNGITLKLGDCIDEMRGMPDGSVDMVMTDPPYGTTACKWDSVIPFEPMWEQLKRIVKPNGAIVLMASQPFTSALVMSNPEMFKYCWVWDKISVTGFANAKRQPLRHMEDVAVFYKTAPQYHPQGLTTCTMKRKNAASDGGASLKGEHNSNGMGALRTPGLERVQEFTNYPKQRLEVPRSGKSTHPTQKPVALMEYLIRTYTNEGETVLDFTMGSGTTGVACARTGREFIGIERDQGYFEIAQERIAKAACEGMGLFSG